MAFNRLHFICSVSALLLFASCNSDNPTQANAATTVVNRLIFTGTADVGGTVKVELDDTRMEAVLDGNADYSNGILPGLPLLLPHYSLVTITISDLDYYGDVVSIECKASSTKKIPLEWKGPAGSYYEGPNGIMYVYDSGLPQYLEQGLDDTITSAVIPVPTPAMGAGYHFYMDCTGSDSSEYRVTLYDRTSPLAHSITTKFDINSGTMEGVVRIHRIGDGYHPFMDILL